MDDYGVFIALGLFIFALYIFVVYIIPALVAFGGIVIVIIIFAAAVIGFILAVSNYFSAIMKNINFRKWEWEKDNEPARRSYFFGPGYSQLKNTIKKAFELNSSSGESIGDVADTIKGNSSGILNIIRSLASILFKSVAYICIYFFGTVLCVVLGFVHGTITTVIMLLSYVIFSVVWIVDRLYLIKNKIRSDCPVCHSRFLIPNFTCPECGAVHKKLVPGPYGIWKHRCTCGHKLPSTFMNGRSKLESCCPECGAILVASDVRPIVFQLVGGSDAGKTVYLSAFFHEYLQKLTNNENLKITITDQYKPFFDELEEWYNGVNCPSTAQRNSQMYPIIIDSSLGVKRQISIYDIAGEMFDGYTANSEIQQQQFRYCDGLLFLIDPFSSGKLRTNRINAGEDVSEFSDISAEDVAANFINYLVNVGYIKVNSRSNIPISILIAKADVKEVKREIGLAKLNSIFRNNEEKYGTYKTARDAVCRQFLIDIGLTSMIDNLETQFSNIHYFPVSAMGHSPDGTPYEPWGVIEAIEWMIPLADKELSDLLISTTVDNQQ